MSVEVLIGIGTLLMMVGTVLMIKAGVMSFNPKADTLHILWLLAGGVLMVLTSMDVKVHVEQLASRGSKNFAGEHRVAPPHDAKKEIPK